MHACSSSVDDIVPDVVILRLRHTLGTEAEQRPKLATADAVALESAADSHTQAAAKNISSSEAEQHREKQSAPLEQSEFHSLFPSLL